LTHFTNKVHGGGGYVEGGEKMKLLENTFFDKSKKVLKTQSRDMKDKWRRLSKKGRTNSQRDHRDIGVKTSLREEDVLGNDRTIS